MSVSSVVGLRDRALIGLMVYCFARVGRWWECASRITTSSGGAGGCACTKKVASSTPCHNLEQYLADCLATGVAG